MGIIEVLIIVLVVVLIIQYVVPLIGIDQRLAGLIILLVLLALLLNHGRLHL